MTRFSGFYWLRIGFQAIALGLGGVYAMAAQGQTPIYQPIAIAIGTSVADQLSVRDIPTGDGGFARDYWVELKKGDQVTIDVISENFDSIVKLLAADGSKVAENDDGPDGTTNSLLFARINDSGKYTVRVQAFGETGSGKFTVKVTRLRPANAN
jgi:hypothetical protein